MQGVLEAEAPATVVRITRQGAINHSAVLDPEQVRVLWSDPLLRYSNLLDGLFHDAVILCEGDADCRYYESVFDNVYADSEDEQAVLRRPQLLFSHCGGKGRFASVVASLKAISVPVVVVADFDILNDAALVERTVIALGGDFELLKADLAQVMASLNSDSKPLGKVALREAVLGCIENIEGETVGKRESEKLRSMIRVESGWDKVKRAGISAIPQGEAYESCQRLLQALKRIGLMVVPVGELERFVPSVGGHGPAWVTQVHQRGLHEDVANEPPRAFIREVVVATGQATA